MKPFKSKSAFILNFLRLYNMIWRLALPFLRKNKRLKHGFEKRTTTGHLPPSDIWIQAASAGEAYLAVKLIQTLEPQKPVAVLVTSITVQGMDILNDHLKPERLHPNLSISIEWFPFDIPKVIQKAVKRINPSIMVLLETELWPALLYFLKENNSEIIMINARLTHKSFKGYMRSRFIWKHLEPDQILTTSGVDQNRYTKLFKNSKIQTMDNIKFEETITVDHNHTREQNIRLIMDQPLPIAVLASIRKQEENVCVQLIRDILSGHPDTLLAVFPRHLHRIDAWKKLLADHKIDFVLRSDIIAPPQNKTIILWDQFGELNTAYQFAHTVFVGGSLKPLGGQNFIEPALAGAATVTGPYYDDFKWVGRKIFDQKIVYQAKTLNEAAAFMTSALKHPQTRQHKIEQCKTYIRSRQGGAKFACDEILKSL